MQSAVSCVCSLNETHKQIAYVLCQCIFEGDMALMRRYIKAGVDIDIGDYDQRTALHIAAAEVNLPAVTSFCSKPTRACLCLCAHRMTTRITWVMATWNYCRSRLLRGCAGGQKGGLMGFHGAQRREVGEREPWGSRRGGRGQAYS